MHGWNEQLNSIQESLSFLIPELILCVAILVLLTAGLFKPDTRILLTGCLLSFISSLIILIGDQFDGSVSLFNGMLRSDEFSSYLKILMDTAGILTCCMKRSNSKEHSSEYYTLLVAVVFGGHLLVMSHDFLMIFLSLEMISISSYVLAGYAFTKTGTEGSLKYFLFGSVASAFMLYGFSLFYGITGTLNFSTEEFFSQLMLKNSPLVLLAACMTLSGFLYKIAAAPMHPWAPDVYEAAPIPVIAFLSVAPKIAGLGVLIKFILAMNLFGQSPYDWQLIVSLVSILSITVGNFSALRQQNPKRMMAYSSIAQSGFLLVGLAAFLPQGIPFILFYATVYLLMNFAVFIYLSYFETAGVTTITGFSGVGKTHTAASILLLIGLISLTGLPPTAGFTAKLLIFSSLWESYEITGKAVVLILLIFGLVNTVISLFYYLRIPYFAFLKSGETAQTPNFLTFENLLGFILVLLLLVMFFIPGLLMGWINKINFVI